MSVLHKVSSRKMMVIVTQWIVKKIMIMVTMMKIIEEDPRDD